MHKTCTVCLILRPLDEFSPHTSDSAYRQLYSNQCKNCAYIRSNLYKQGASPVPNDLVREIVNALEGTYANV